MSFCVVGSTGRRVAVNGRSSFVFEADASPPARVAEAEWATTVFRRFLILGKVRSMWSSGDATLLLSVGNDAHVRIMGVPREGFNAEEGRPTKLVRVSRRDDFPHFDERVVACATSPGERLLVTGSHEHSKRIYVIDLVFCDVVVDVGVPEGVAALSFVDATHVAVLLAKSRRIMCLVLHQDFLSRARAHRAQTGVPLTLEMNKAPSAPRPSGAVRNPPESTAAAASSTNAELVASAVAYWGAPPAAAFPSASDRLSALVVGPRSRWMAAGTSQGEVFVWIASSLGDPEKLYASPEGKAVIELVASPDGAFLAVAFAETTTVRLIALRSFGDDERKDPPEAVLLRAPEEDGGRLGQPVSVSFHPSSLVVAVAYSTRIVAALFDVATGVCLQRCRAEGALTTEDGSTAPSKVVTTVTSELVVIFFDLPSRNLLLGFTTENELVAWNVSSVVPQVVLPFLSRTAEPLTAVAVGGVNDSLVAAATLDGEVVLWSLDEKGSIAESASSDVGTSPRPRAIAPKVTHRLSSSDDDAHIGVALDPTGTRLVVGIFGAAAPPTMVVLQTSTGNVLYRIAVASTTPSTAGFGVTVPSQRRYLLTGPSLSVKELVRTTSPSTSPAIVDVRENDAIFDLNNAGDMAERWVSVPPSAPEDERLGALLRRRNDARAGLASPSSAIGFSAPPLTPPPAPALRFCAPLGAALHPETFVYGESSSSSPPTTTVILSVTLRGLPPVASTPPVVVCREGAAPPPSANSSSDVLRGGVVARVVWRTADGTEVASLEEGDARLSRWKDNAVTIEQLTDERPAAHVVKGKE